MLVPVLTLLAVACGEAQLEAPPVPGSGIRGRVLIGPQCPVVHVESPCPDLPFDAEIRVVRADSEEVVATVRSGPDGRFLVALPPGDYVLEPVPPTPGDLPRAAPVPVTVGAHRFTSVTVVFDTGIR